MMYAHHAWGHLRHCYYQHVASHPSQFQGDRIYPRVWLGDLTTAYDQGALRRRGISHIINLVPGIHLAHPDVTYLNLPCLDRDDYDMAAHFERTNAFIDAALSQATSRVLIHCSAGRSRSVTIAVAYRIHSVGGQVEHILDHIREKRPMAEPNPGFMAQLRAYEDACGSDEDYSSDYESDT